jgi:class 3 adenylate cyclase
MRISIGHKIFGLASLVVVLTLVVTIINVRLSFEVKHELDRVTTRYIAAHAALSRARAASLEQALHGRGVLIARLILDSDELTSAEEKSAAEKSDAIRGYLAEFREIVKLEIAHPSPFIDPIDLGRVDENIAQIADEQEQYDQKLAKSIKLIKDKNLKDLSRELQSLNDFRIRFNATLDNAVGKIRERTTQVSAGVSAFQQKVAWISLALVMLASLLALLVAWALTQQLVKPVRRLLKTTGTVIDGKLDVTLPVTSSDEVGQLTTAFNKMTEGLRTAKRIRDTFGQYVDPRIVKNLIDNPEVSIEGGYQQMTVMFFDMAGFSYLGEGMTPRGLVKVLNRYFSLISETVHEYGGVIDKYIGDAVMVYWGAPFNDSSEQAYLATAAAVDGMKKIVQLQNELPELLGIRKNLPLITARVGIATGDVLVGNIGSEHSKSFTVMGDVVNLASRLEGINKVYGTSILVSEQTMTMGSARFEYREVDRLIAAGTSESANVYDVLGPKNQLSAAVLKLRDNYAAGLDAYRLQEWSQAEASFTECLLEFPTDGASKAMLARIAEFKISSPPPNWNGAWKLDRK